MRQLKNKNNKILRPTKILYVFILIIVFQFFVLYTVINNRAPIRSKAASPSTTPTQAIKSKIKLDIKLKLQGITKEPLSNNNLLSVKITLLTLESKVTATETISIKADNQGTFLGEVIFNQDPGNYYLAIKGAKHLRAVFICENPVSTKTGSYTCNNSSNNSLSQGIMLREGINEFDFSKTILLTGDLSTQDGIINSSDFAIIRDNLGKTDTSALEKADLNLDGVIDTQDWSLVLNALSITNEDFEYPKNLLTPTPTIILTSVPTVTSSPTVTSYPVTKDEENRIYSTASCRVDYKEALTLDELSKKIVKLCQDNYQKIEQKLGNDKIKLPFNIRFNSSLTAPANASGSDIALSTSYFTQHPDDMGAIIHEMAHTVQAYPSGEPFWLIEGIADYVRYWMGYQSVTSYAHCPPGKNYTSGYWCSAAFLEYLEKTYDKDIVTKLDAVLRSGSYNDSLFITYTGKDLPQLWSECKNKDCAGGSE